MTTKEIGFSSTRYLAPIAPLMAIALYLAGMLMITEDLSRRGAVIIGAISTVLTAIAYFNI